MVTISQNNATEDIRLSVVIVTYNRSRDLKETLESLFQMTTKPYEVIVVDSNSADDTRQVVESYEAKFIMIKEKSMVKARNTGLEKASGNVVAFIDDDVVVTPDWSKHIIDLYKDENVGGVGGRVLPLGNRPEISGVNVKFQTIGKLYDNGFITNNYDLVTKRPIEVDVLIGCNMSFRRRLLQKIKGFDTNFKGTCFREDTDVSTRIKRLNYKLLYNPEALLYHKYKGKKINQKWFYWYAYNHFYFCFKNLQPVNLTKAIKIFRGAFLPPGGYMKKSGIQLRIGPLVGFNIIAGILDANRAYRRTRANNGI